MIGMAPVLLGDIHHAQARFQAVFHHLLHKLLAFILVSACRDDSIAIARELPNQCFAEPSTRTCYKSYSAFRILVSPMDAREYCGDGHTIMARIVVVALET